MLVLVLVFLTVWEVLGVPLLVVGIPLAVLHHLVVLEVLLVVVVGYVVKEVMLVIYQSFSYNIIKVTYQT